MARAALCLELVLRVARAERLFFEARPKERPNERVPILPVLPNSICADNKTHHFGLRLCVVNSEQFS